MKIVQGDELQFERGLEHRGGTFHFRRLLEGTPGRIDNFQLSLGKMGGDFYSPRHRHNFEQVRFQLEGTLDYDRNGKLTAGMVGYFPEGMFYGPQSQDPSDTPMTLVLQCGGASGSGYLARNEVKAAMDELANFGDFKDGVFRRHDAPTGKRNLDGYQAIWEHVNGRPMAYPKPRYNAPIFMDPEHFDWIARADAPGVQERRLGTFSECGTQADFLKLAPGATLEGVGRSIYFCISGEGTVSDEPLRRFTTVFLDRGETARFGVSGEAATLYRLGLPDLSHLMTGADGGNVTAAAAE